MDLNASLHGNWTLENAKARLNQFFQKEKITSEYKYSQVGPDHNRSGRSSLASGRVGGRGVLLCWTGQGSGPPLGQLSLNTRTHNA